MYSLQALVFERTVVSIAAAVAAGFSLCAPAAGQEDAPPDERGIPVVEVRDVRIDAAWPALQKRVPEVMFEDLPLEQAVEFISEFGELNLIVNWQVLEDAGVARDVPVTIKRRNLRLSQILWHVLNEAAQNKTELGYDLHGDTMVVASTVADLEAYNVMKIYDVRPLLRVAERWDGQWLERRALGAVGTRRPYPTAETPTSPDTSAPEVSAQVSGGRPAMGHQTGPEHPRRAQFGRPDDQLVELVEQAVRPETWLVNGGDGTAHCFGSVLVVRASRSVHRQLEAFLNALLESVVETSQQG